MMTLKSRHPRIVAAQLEALSEINAALKQHVASIRGTHVCHCVWTIADNSHHYTLCEFRTASDERAGPGNEAKNW